MIALEILNILGEFEPPARRHVRPRGWTDAAWLHLQLEAAKLAFADRDAWLTDPTFRDVPVERAPLAGACRRTLAARIDPRRADPSPPPARTLVGGTIYLAVVDGEGNAVSLIQSNAAGFGSGVVDAATGVHFQDRGASFSLDPAHPNVLAARQADRTHAAPGDAVPGRRRRPWVVGGSMGGDIQPQIHVQLVSALVDGDADLATAVAAPRVTVEPDGWFAPPVAVRRGRGARAGVEDGLRRLATTSRGSTTARSATSTRSSWSTAGRPRVAPGGDDRSAQRRASGRPVARSRAVGAP